MKKWPVLIVIVGTALLAVIYWQHGKPTRKEIARLEACVRAGKLPVEREDAFTPRWTDIPNNTIDNYARYYATETRNGEVVIIAEFVWALTET